MERKYFTVFHNPDYRWANKMTVKTTFQTLLYNDILYIMDSESEVGRQRVVALGFERLWAREV